MALLIRAILCIYHAGVRVCPLTTVEAISHGIRSLIFVGTDISNEFRYMRDSCIAWYIYQEVATDLLVAATEIILMIRGTRSLYFAHLAADRRANQSMLYIIIKDG